MFCTYNNRVSRTHIRVFHVLQKTPCFTRLVSINVFRKSDMAWFWLRGNMAWVSPDRPQIDVTFIFIYLNNISYFLFELPNCSRNTSHQVLYNDTCLCRKFFKHKFNSNTTVFDPTHGPVPKLDTFSLHRFFFDARQNRQTLVKPVGQLGSHRSMTSSSFLFFLFFNFNVAFNLSLTLSKHQLQPTYDSMTTVIYTEVPCTVHQTLQHERHRW